MRFEAFCGLICLCALSRGSAYRAVYDVTCVRFDTIGGSVSVTVDGNAAWIDEALRLGSADNRESQTAHRFTYCAPDFCIRYQLARQLLVGVTLLEPARISGQFMPILPNGILPYDTLKAGTRGPKFMLTDVEDSAEATWVESRLVSGTLDRPRRLQNVDHLNSEDIVTTWTFSDFRTIDGHTFPGEITKSLSFGERKGPMISWHLSSLEPANALPDVPGLLPDGTSVQEYLSRTKVETFTYLHNGSPILDQARAARGNTRNVTTLNDPAPVTITPIAVVLVTGLVGIGGAARLVSGRRRVLRKNRAFTLIEVLVVMAILAVVLAILLPVFSRSRIAALESVAISNAGQVSKAEMLYLGDWDGRYTPAEQGLFHDAPFRAWPQLVSHYVQPVVGHGLDGCALSQDLPAVFFDPIKPNLPQELGDSCPVSGWGISNSIADFERPPNNAPGSRIPVVTSQVAKPAECILFIDTVEDYGHPGQAYAGQYIANTFFDVYGFGVTSTIDFPYPSGPRMRAEHKPDHHNSAIVAFCDGHVKPTIFARVDSGDLWSLGGNGQYP